MVRQRLSGTGRICDPLIIIMRNFIRHPVDIPIKIIKDESRYVQPLQDISVSGLRCRSDEALEMGAEIKIVIDLVKPTLEIQGKVIWCRAIGSSYELGIEYHGEQDAYRLRMVEQICHIEHYKKEVQIREGRTISSEQAANEWIGKYAEKFPR